MIIKKFKKFISERFGSYSPTPQESPKINQYSQGTPNGMAGTSDPSMNTVDPDDQIKVGYKRFTRDFNPNKNNSIIYGKREKRHWRDRRKDKKIKINELFEPRDVDYEILDIDTLYTTDTARKNEYTVTFDRLDYKILIEIQDEFMSIDFFKMNPSDGKIHNYKEMTGDNNMLKILTLIGYIYEDFKKMLINENIDYIINEFVVSPSKQDSESIHSKSDVTKRGKIYKYFLDSKLKDLNPTFYTDRNEMTYRFDPTISVQKINLL